MESSNNSDNLYKTMLKNKKKWGLFFLILVILFLVWLLFLYVRGKLRLKDTNNNNMISAYEERGGTKLGSINSSNPQHIYLLRDYYVFSSYNSCCGGNSIKDFVDMIPLKQVIKQGARLLDFEIYSKNGNAIVAAGPEATPNGKYCIKGTYNSLSFRSVMENVKMNGYSGQACPNPDDPLFLSFRIKTNNKNIYPGMASVLRKLFGGQFLHARYSHEGRNIRSGKDNIANIPLLNLRRKVIIIVQDPNNNFRGTPFHEFVNISGKGKDGTGMPFASFSRNIDIVQAYDPKSIKNENKKFLGFSQPDFSKVTENPPAAIHHSFGFQFAMMNFSYLDANMIYYLDFFSKKGSAFVLKPNHLRYFERKIKPPKPQDPKLSYGPRPQSMLGGVYKPSI